MFETVLGYLLGKSHFELKRLLGQQWHVNETQLTEYSQCFNQSKILLDKSIHVDSILKFFELSLNYFQLTSFIQEMHIRNANISLLSEDNYRNLIKSIRNLLVKWNKLEMTRAGEQEFKVFTTEIGIFNMLLNVKISIDLTLGESGNNQNSARLSDRNLRRINKQVYDTDILAVFCERLNSLRIETVISLRAAFNFSSLKNNNDKILSKFDEFFLEKFLSRPLDSFKSVYYNLKDTDAKVLITKLADKWTPSRRICAVYSRTILSCS